ELSLRELLLPFLARALWGGRSRAFCRELQPEPHSVQGGEQSGRRDRQADGCALVRLRGLATHPIFASTCRRRRRPGTCLVDLESRPDAGWRALVHPGGWLRSPEGDAADARRGAPRN